MAFTVLNWNVGGAKFLEKKDRAERDVIKETINKALDNLINHVPYVLQPDVITLQEIVQFKEPKDERVQDLIDEIPGYHYFPFPLINSGLLSATAKWKNVRYKSDWDPKAYFAQGNAILFKTAAPHFPVFDLSNLQQSKPESPQKHFIEEVHLDTGLYFGDRDTEPRAALIAHFIYNPGNEHGVEPLPLDIFVINLHLTTLRMEREGIPEIDANASRIRHAQLDVVFNGIVSRYNRWRQSGFRLRDDRRESEAFELFKRYSPIWIIAGDFNFTEESSEYARVLRTNFIDTVKPINKATPFGHGTKAKGECQDPTLTLDYIFAGPKFVSLSPAIADYGLGSNRVIHDHKVRASDHYPIVSHIDFIPIK